MSSGAKRSSTAVRAVMRRRPSPAAASAPPLSSSAQRAISGVFSSFSPPPPPPPSSSSSAWPLPISGGDGARDAEPDGEAVAEQSADEAERARDADGGARAHVELRVRAQRKRYTRKVKT